jgi:hypothetical protein
MIVDAPAFLAIWNSCNPERSDYDAWHTLEHVPERLEVPGFLGARRYVGGEGPLPEYLTVYDLSSLSVLDSKPYRELLNRPTPWSLDMRPDLSEVIRHGCRTHGRVGQGFGGIAAVKILDLDERCATAPWDLTPLSSSQAISAATLGTFDSSVAELPFSLGASDRSVDGNAVLILESYSGPALRRALASVDEWLESLGGTGPHLDWTIYRLGFVIEAQQSGLEEELT